jgi:hypothetical protein
VPKSNIPKHYRKSPYQSPLAANVAYFLSSLRIPFLYQPGESPEFFCEQMSKIPVREHPSGLSRYAWIKLKEAQEEFDAGAMSRALRFTWEHDEPLIVFGGLEQWWYSPLKDSSLQNARWILEDTVQVGNCFWCGSWLAPVYSSALYQCPHVAGRFSGRISIVDPISNWFNSEDLATNFSDRRYVQRLVSELKWQWHSRDNFIERFL